MLASQSMRMFAVRMHMALWRRGSRTKDLGSKNGAQRPGPCAHRHCTAVAMHQRTNGVCRGRLCTGSGAHQCPRVQTSAPQVHKTKAMTQVAGLGPSMKAAVRIAWQAVKTTVCGCIIGL